MVIATIYIAAMEDQAWREHVLADLHDLAQRVAAMAAQVSEMHTELEQFRPVLRMFRPGNGTSDVQRAGVLKSIRRAARDGRT